MVRPPRFCRDKQAFRHAERWAVARHLRHGYNPQETPNREFWLCLMTCLIPNL